MGNNSQQYDLIMQICRTRGLNADDTFDISKKLLENYRSALWIHSDGVGNITSIISGEGSRMVKQWYVDYSKLSRSDQRDASINSAIFHVCRTKWIIDAVDNAMSGVKDFADYGEVYHDILSKAYFADEKMTDQEIMDELCMERSTYYRRKKEAVFLFGILMWDQVRAKKFA